MKLLTNALTALLLLFSCLVATDANAEMRRQYAPTPQDLEELSEKLIELESNELLTIDDLKDYIKQVEDFAVAYYHAKKSTMDKRMLASRALEDVKKYADEIKANGSTRDMMECGFLNTAICHYYIAINSNEMRGQIILPVVDAMTDEIVAWQKLENTLTDVYAYSAFMENQGGSMASISASGSAWDLAEARRNDTDMLLKAGVADEARHFPMMDEMRKQATATVKFLTTRAKDLLDCDDDFKASPYYKEVSKGLTEACAKLDTDMDAWVSARIRVVGCLQEQGIGIDGTFKLLSQIKKIGTPEQ